MNQSAARTYRVAQVDWQTGRHAIRAVREAVFVRELGIPAELEFDGRDAGCVHAVAWHDERTPVGVARLQADGHIGRVAVLPDWRGHGIGSALLAMLVQIARDQGQARVWLTAQRHAEDFYRRHGFESQGEVFEEAGIPHRAMQRDLR
jgi:predicted GNAT family N-acyltransferase